MLQKARELGGYKLSARDGEIGKVKEFYFDDRSWIVRYLVADTGGWLSGRRVLISPYALDEANIGNRVIPVDLTRTQIERSHANMNRSTTHIMAGPDTGAARTHGGKAPTRSAGRMGRPKPTGRQSTIFMGRGRHMGGRTTPKPLAARRSWIFISAARRM
jgi:hypothetical protein